ncbi:hypothetical protein J2X04_002504 [Lysobacter niabensis]|uniref:Oxidoreductase n=1 Tax=Agrilutibacter niabensis TaxID=380628 RepID=A0ABU1VSN3_9GAMM|nr:hypothetical protein [Lysobacter niabensis]
MSTAVTFEPTMTCEPAATFGIVGLGTSGLHHAPQH